MRRLPVKFLLRYGYNVLRIRLPGGADKTRVKPLMASLYLTTKCNFRCTYCDDGSGNLYPHLPEPNRLGTTEVIRVLDIVRRASPGIAVTGGEPTLRPDLITILAHVTRLGFSPVALNTNGYLLDRHLDVLPHLDYLAVSLDSVDEARSDALINAGPGSQTRRVKHNLDLVREHRRRRGLKFDILVNTVILPETIDDAWDVLGYCLDHGDFWTPMPHIVGKYPHPGLVDNPRWHELVQEILRLKRRGARICGNRRALELIDDFSRFECYPTTRPVIYPNGDVFYPCAPLGFTAVNLLEIGTYARALDRGRQQCGPIPRCDSRCHVGCYTEPSTAIAHPGTAIVDVMRCVLARSKHIQVQKPTRQADRRPPPSLCQLKELPSCPPDTIRALRRAGHLVNDFSSLLRTSAPAEKGGAAR